MQLPFDGGTLDRLMDEAGIDLMLATDKDTVQYLLGGYRYFFLAHKDAVGISRYLPVLGYPKGKPESTFYIGHPLEPHHQEIERPWAPTIRNTQKSSAHAAREAAAQIRERGLGKGCIGVEMCFIPADAYLALREELPGATFVDALPMMQELRAVKRPDELAKLKRASELIVEVMTLVMTTTPTGTTKREIVDRVRREEVERGMNFEYCLAATGRSFNRAPSDRPWSQGEIMSLDSGANLDGYLGDLCRMAVMGEPTNLMRDVMGEVRAIQAAARSVVRAGVHGREVVDAARAVFANSERKSQIIFRAHGMGMIQHEAPHIDGEGAISYPATYADKPLRAGMVLSIETDIKSPEVGFVKMEDTVVVTESGCEGYGDATEDWVIATG